MERPQLQPPIGYEIASKTIQLRQGRTVDIQYFQRIQDRVVDTPLTDRIINDPDFVQYRSDGASGISPEDISSGERMAVSLIVAFRHLLDEAGDGELPDDDMANIFTYALNEEVDEAVIDAAFQRAVNDPGNLD
ncbi:MAG TPA: hypothetical protein VM581_00240 [Magnetospirillaceae bacterium]|nr:hypothetical protein [Magnetospirillaceae bacterium]